MVAVAAALAIPAASAQNALSPRIECLEGPRDDAFQFVGDDVIEAVIETCMEPLRPTMLLDLAGAETTVEQDVMLRTLVAIQGSGLYGNLGEEAARGSDLQALSANFSDAMRRDRARLDVMLDMVHDTQGPDALEDTVMGAAIRQDVANLTQVSARAFDDAFTREAGQHARLVVDLATAGARMANLEATARIFEETAATHQAFADALANGSAPASAPDAVVDPNATIGPDSDANASVNATAPVDGNATNDTTQEAIGDDVRNAPGLGIVGAVAAAILALGIARRRTAK